MCFTNPLRFLDKKNGDHMYSEKDFEIIKSAILEEITPIQIILFGSYAKGNQDENSDIDIMVLLKEEISRREKLNILTRIEKRFLILKYPIDLIIKSIESFKSYSNYVGTINYDAAREGKILWMKS